MNYIELINQFWRTRRTKKMTSNEADLYYFLLQECNLRGWVNPFDCPNTLITAMTGLSNKSLVCARSALKQKGLIDFQCGARRSKTPAYEVLVSVETKNETKTETKNGGKTGTKTETKTGNIILNKTKTETKTFKENQKEIFDFGFVENGFEVFLEWLEYKKSRKESYKTQKSLEICYKRLKELSGGAPEIAKLIVEQSIGNNWQGLFELKSRSSGGAPVMQKVVQKSKLEQNAENLARTLEKVRNGEI